MSGSWPCRCVTPAPHPNLEGLCQCGGYHITLTPAAQTFKPVPEKPITTLKPRTEK